METKKIKFELLAQVETLQKRVGELELELGIRANGSLDQESNSPTYAYFNNAIENMPVGFMHFDNNDRLVLFNKEILALFPEHHKAGLLKKGIRLEDLIRFTAQSESMNVSENSEQWLKQRLVDYKSEKESNFEMAFGNGRWHQVLDRNSPEGWLSIRIDITERKKVEAALQESEQRLRSVLDNSPEAITLKDMDGRYILVNRIFAERRGVLPEEIIGKRSSDFFPAEFANRLKAHAQEVLTTGEVVAREYEVQFPDGTQHTIMNSQFPVKNIGGEVIGVGAISADLTNERKAEKQLLHANKMEAIGVLAGGIAHNFNNLLQVISGGIGIIELGMDARNQEYEILASIKKSIKRGSYLTSQLLGFAAGGKYKVEPFNLNETIDRVATMVIETHKNIQQFRAFEENLRPVEGDQNQIEQVVLNILINALQAMPNGGQLTLKTENVIPDEVFFNLYSLVPEQYVKLSITDTGEGMERNVLTRIFEPFYTTKGMTQGTGLGLASSHGIIKNHGGVITAESEVGIGTTIDIYLPGSKKDVAIDMEDSVEITRKGSGTILLVDDEINVANMGKRVLKILGFHVFEAHSGTEALELYEKHLGKIDLVILDMIMPEMGGGETFDKLRSLDPTVKVLLSSGYSIDGMASEIIDRGCIGFIQKPFDLTNLSGTIHEVLSQK